MPDEIICTCPGGGAQTSGYPVDQPRAPLAQLGPLGIWVLAVGRSWFAPVGMARESLYLSCVCPILILSQTFCAGCAPLQMMDNEEGRALQSLGGLGTEWHFIISAVSPGHRK